MPTPSSRTYYQKMNSRIKNLFFSFILFWLLGASSAALAAGLVPCDGVDNCNTAAFFLGIDRIVNYFVFSLAVPIATIAIAWAGITMALHPAEEGKRTEAKKIIQATVIGLILTLGAWLIVNTLVKYLVKPDVAGQINSNASGVLNNR